MSAKHSSVIRGLLRGAAPPPPPQTFQGRFGKLFPRLAAARFGSSDAEQSANLKLLADKMVADFDAPKDGPDAEESGIPALYTYLGQFVDHDLTFDPASSFQQRKDPDALTDFRTPAFDLDNVYGRGPGDQPYLYQEDGKSFVLGDPFTLGDPNARDLPRTAAGRALIGDPRNDENTIVSQVHGLFLQFHNRLVAENPQLPFEEIQQLLRFHYQYVVLNDFLPRIISDEVLASLKTGGRYEASKLRVFDRKNPIMPVEFSGAAYRLGHSMVRPGYRLNDATLLPIFPLPAETVPNFPEGLTGFRRPISDWGIDWGRFIDVDVRKYHVDPKKDNGIADFRRLQFAYRIDTSLVDPLGSLPASVAGNPPASLALRNLLRGVQLQLPSAQAIAAALEVPVLSDDKILIGKAVDDQPQFAAINTISGAFKGNCPLWTYVLAEAIQHKKQVSDVPVAENAAKSGTVKINAPQLGPVGGRIVAEVFLGLMFADSLSLLSSAPGWVPPRGVGGAGFALKDFVRFALGH